ncbi:hypothetical protein ACJBU6_06232 [Exserohilum turcicum]
MKPCLHLSRTGGTRHAWSMCCAAWPGMMSSVRPGLRLAASPLAWGSWLVSTIVCCVLGVVCFRLDYLQLDMERCNRTVIVEAVQSDRLDVGFSDSILNISRDRRQNQVLHCGCFHTTHTSLL